MSPLAKGCRLVVWGLAVLLGVGLGATLTVTGMLALYALMDPHVPTSYALVFPPHVLAFVGCLKLIPRLWPFRVGPRA